MLTFTNHSVSFRSNLRLQSVVPFKFSQDNNNNKKTAE